ncbi:hypothetical protein OAQ34_01085 [Opitutales bacterium]|nr:hypothetical protein [Opitutales bacterium]
MVINRRVNQSPAGYADDHDLETSGDPLPALGHTVLEVRHPSHDMQYHQNQSNETCNNMNIRDRKGKGLEISQPTCNGQSRKAKQKAKIDQVSHLKPNAHSCLGC